MNKVFDNNWQKYDFWFDKNRFVYLSELEAVKKLMPWSGTGIEIGVGTGRFAQPLGISLGVEPSFQMARMACHRGIEVAAGKGEQLPFPDSSLDYFLLVTTICFLDDVKKTFKEVRRALKPGGKVIVGFVDRLSKLGKSYQKHRQQSDFYANATFYSVPEVLAVLKSCSFDRFEITQTLFQPLAQIEALEPVKEGYGQGAFVVVSAQMV